MIKLTNINKYFNKGKSNEIHVINNTSLKFPDKGLVAITGPSGCGKTTLLNVVGGLDSFSSGEINFDGQVIKKYKPLDWDVLRNHYVGYIFQNYNLITDKTVYENIEIALNMAGLNNKKEIEERINYVLEAVGMYNFRKRNVKALSGGQQQRVAIARAIAKSPKVVLADEPTGNLDANNTFEIMSIIKKISQTCLVILVSHERSLVEFYADRIIEVADGKVIKDYESSGNKSMEHLDDRNIYLKDLNYDDSAKENNIIRYYEKEKDDSLDFQVIEVKDTIYVKTNTKSNKKIKYITDDSEVRLIDDHYKAKQSHEALDYKFDMSQYEDIKEPKNKKSFIRFTDSLMQGFRKVTRKRKFIGKLLLLVYFVISALIVYQLATFASLTKLEDKDFLNVARNMVSVESEQKLTSTDLQSIINGVDGVEWSPYSSSAYARITYQDFYQGNIDRSLNVYPVKASWIDPEQILYGNLPTNGNEVAIDEWVANDLLEDKWFSDLGVTDIEDLIGSYIYTQNPYSYKFEIVGITNTASPVVVVEDDAIFSFANENIGEYMAYGSAKDKITITEGRGIQNDNEILVSESFGTNNLGDTLMIKDVTYTIVGTYQIIPDEFESLQVYFQEVVVANAVIERELIANIDEGYYYSSSTAYFHSDDIAKAITDIEALNDKYEAVDSYEAQKSNQLLIQQEQISARVSSVIITLGGIMVYIFFMMRSSMLARIKEIGIYRSIGATKRDIYKIFFGEIFWFTTLGSLSGYLLMSLLVNRVQNAIGDLVQFFYFPIHYFVGGIVGIYLINIIFGLLPIFSLLRKTPSEINAKYDI